MAKTGRPKKPEEEKTKMVGVRILISLCEKLLPYCDNSYSKMINMGLDLLEKKIDQSQCNDNKL